jgi:hypothetical protein
VESLVDDFNIEQKEIVEIIKNKERRITNSGGEGSEWNRFNGDLACRVVKGFLKRHLPKQMKVAGPNVYIDGYPAEFDLRITIESAIPEAFTNAYSNRDLRFVIEIISQSYVSLDFPEQLLSQFTTLQKQYPNVNCTFLTIRETWNPKRDDSISYVGELRKVLEPHYRVFCLAESRTMKLIPGQWREFVNHLAATG